MCSNGRVAVNGEYGSAGNKTCPSATFHAIHFTFTVLGSNPDLCCEMSVIISFLETTLPFCVSRAEQNKKRRDEKKQMKVATSVEEFGTKKKEHGA
jgi:hypothetical protein